MSSAEPARRCSAHVHLRDAVLTASLLGATFATGTLVLSRKRTTAAPTLISPTTP